MTRDRTIDRSLHLAAIAIIVTLLQSTIQPSLAGRRRLDDTPLNSNGLPLFTPLPCSNVAVAVPTISDMTLDEKIGQMAQVDQTAIINSTESENPGDDIAKYFIGSILNGGGGAPVWGNRAVDWADLVDHIQGKTAKTRLKIPVLYGIDAVHGNSNIFGATLYPHHIGLGATRNTDLARKMGATTARELAGMGIRWAFAPTIAVCRDPRWGRCYESYGEIPSLVNAMGAAEIQGWQTTSNSPSDPAYAVPGDVLVSACAKHFVGDGSTLLGVNEGNTISSESQLDQIELPPYIAAIQQNVETMMVSFSSFNSFKMSGNYHLLTQVLKKQLNFTGLLVSDWQAIDQLPGTINEQVRHSINAGLDMIMIPTDYKSFLTALKEEVVAGRVPISRIDDAVGKILKLKEKLGLFKNSCAQRSLLNLTGALSTNQIAREAVAQSLVLLKNENRTAPGSPIFPLLVKEKTILVAGSHAHNLGLQMGGWSMTWQGAAGNNMTVGTTFLTGIEKALLNTTTAVTYVETPIGDEVADYGLVFVGEQTYAETKGDNQALQLDGTSQLAIDNVCSHMPCIVVLISGRPLEVDYILPNVDALVAAWLPGTEAGHGFADVAFGEKDFTGKTAFSWFVQANQLPMTADMQPYNPLFPLNFGLNKAGHPLP